MTNQDQIVLKQAILRHKDREVRQKREIPIPTGPGWTTVGSVFDCNRKHFERVLKAYWNRLYVGWNPFKNEGRGCWEVWATPNRKVPVLQYEDNDMALWVPEYQPSDFEHWVADLDYLSYDFIAKLQKMDSWENKQQVSQHDDKYEEDWEKAEQKEEDNIKYVVKHNRQLFRDLLDYTQQGFDPTQFFRKK